MRDLVMALRGFRRTPTFTITVLVILGLGIGMATAVFSVYHAVLLRRLPVRDQDRLLVMAGQAPGTFPAVPIPYAAYTELRDGSRALTATAGFQYGQDLGTAMSDQGTTRLVRFGNVTGNFFETLGTRPVLGRLLEPSDDIPSTRPAMVLSYAAWQQFFLGDRRIIGHEVSLPDFPVTAVIVGVAPSGLKFPGGVDAWMPALWSLPDTARKYMYVDVVARLAPGASVAQARTEFLNILHASRPGVDPDIMRHLGATIQTVPEAVVGNVRPALVALATAVILLLLIVCANVGNLLLVRAAGRSHELAIRRALGASYAHVLRQLLAESVLLSAAGGALGIVLAVALVRLFLALAPPGLPQLDTIHPGVVQGIVAAVVALHSGATFGHAPALWSARSDLASPLRAGARGGGGARHARRARSVLVAWQVALSVVVLAGAGIVGRSLERLQHVDLGYRPDGVAIASMDWPLNVYPTAEAFYDPLQRMVAAIEALPGVVAATPVAREPLSGTTGFDGSYLAEGEANTDARSRFFINVEVAGADYFRTFAIPVLRGRAFTDADREDAPHAAIVSEAAARLYWPGEDPIGKRLRPTCDNKSTRTESQCGWMTVVGLVPDTRYRAFPDVVPTLYYAYRQLRAPAGYLGIRTVGPPGAMAQAIKRAMAEVEPKVLPSQFDTMNDLLGAALAQPRLNALLLSAFALTALLLAAVGLYATTASAVRQQTNELGVRIALGATPRCVLRFVLVRAFSVMGAGLVAGVVAAVFASRLLRSMLYEVSPTDPVTLAVVCVVLLAVAGVAAYLPARRATRIDPVRALRAE